MPDLSGILDPAGPVRFAREDGRREENEAFSLRAWY
jgi:hypothetical protein